MNHSAAMRFVQRIRDLRSILQYLLQRQRPFLQVEMFSLRKSTPAYRRGLYDFLVGHGYEVHRMEGHEQFLGDRITAENLMQWNVYDVFCVPAR